MRTASSMHSELRLVGLSTAGLSSGGRTAGLRSRRGLSRILAGRYRRQRRAAGRWRASTDLRAVGRYPPLVRNGRWAVGGLLRGGMIGFLRFSVCPARRGQPSVPRKITTAARRGGGLLSPATAGAPAGCTHAAGGRVFFESLDRPALLRGCSRGFENEVGVHRPSTEGVRTQSAPPSGGVKAWAG